MTDFSEKLSAYLDGELSAADAIDVEQRLASDPAAQAMLDDLMQADAAAADEFDTMLNDPVPLALVQQIKATPLKAKPVPSRPIWGTLAASLVVFALGGVGGYVMRGQDAPVQTAGWLADIADYHRVYANEERHLVEVGADESDHIQTWLGNVVGAQFSIPDLTGFGLTFEGGRLLVANGKPVAQLMYRLADGTVIALCLQQSNSDGPGATGFRERTINGFDFVSWTADGADYVVVGPGGQPQLTDIAAAAALEV